MANLAEEFGDEIQNQVNLFINQSNENVIKLIRMFSQTTYSSNDPEPYKSDFNQIFYDLLSKCCDITNLYIRTKEMYGDIAHLDKPKKMEDNLNNQQLVSRFQAVYKSNSKIDFNKLL